MATLLKIKTPHHNETSETSDSATHSNIPGDPNHEPTANLHETQSKLHRFGYKWFIAHVPRYTQCETSFEIWIDVVCWTYHLQPF